MSPVETAPTPTVAVERGFDGERAAGSGPTGTFDPLAIAHAGPTVELVGGDGVPELSTFVLVGHRPFRPRVLRTQTRVR